MINTPGAGAEISSQRFTFLIWPTVPLSRGCFSNEQPGVHPSAAVGGGTAWNPLETEGVEPRWGSVMDMKAKGESCLLTLGEPSGSEKTPGLPPSFSCL